jgi:hypothetical protein
MEDNVKAALLSSLNRTRHAQFDAFAASMVVYGFASALMSMQIITPSVYMLICDLADNAAAYRKKEMNA